MAMLHVPKPPLATLIAWPWAVEEEEEEEEESLGGGRGGGKFIQS